MACLRCNNPETVNISAWARDCFCVAWEVDDEVVNEHNGYWPDELPQLGGSDEMNLTICLKCGTVQELFV